jgi:hypothetical protein
VWTKKHTFSSHILVLPDYSLEIVPQKSSRGTADASAEILKRYLPATKKTRYSLMAWWILTVTNKGMFLYALS